MWGWVCASAFPACWKDQGRDWVDDYMLVASTRMDGKSKDRIYSHLEVDAAGLDYWSDAQEREEGDDQDDTQGFGCTRGWMRAQFSEVGSLEEEQGWWKWWVVLNLLSLKYTWAIPVEVQPVDMWIWGSKQRSKLETRIWEKVQRVRKVSPKNTRACRVGIGGPGWAITREGNRKCDINGIEGTVYFKEVIRLFQV